MGKKANVVARRRPPVGAAKKEIGKSHRWLQTSLVFVLLRGIGGEGKTALSYEALVTPSSNDFCGALLCCAKRFPFICD
jgi:hypothetical protein